MAEGTTVYRERTPWAGWVVLVYWGSLGGVAAALLLGVDAALPLPLRATVALAVLGAGWALTRGIAGLTVLVQKRRLVLFLGSYPLIKRVVPYEEIVGLESVEYRPILDFGGWGARGLGRKKAWTARGSRAVLLHLTRGRELYVGSDHPRRLEERIRTTAGDRLGASVEGGGTRGSTG